MSTVLSQIDRRRLNSWNDGPITFDLPYSNDVSIDKTITVRLADCDGQRSAANMLINRKYSARGYGSDHKLSTGTNCVAFTASSKGSLIGTMSLTADSADGLASDKTFKHELDKLRAMRGVKLCELTRFAFDTSKPTMDLKASLFHIIFIYATRHFECTDAVIEVAKRHCRFYEVMLGFACVGEPIVNESVGVTSHLMRLDLSDMRRMIDDPSIVSSRSLYPYFFSPKEEDGIYHRLASPVAEPAPLTARNRLRTALEALSLLHRPDRAGTRLAAQPRSPGQPTLA